MRRTTRTGQGARTTRHKRLCAAEVRRAPWMSTGPVLHVCSWSLQPCDCVAGTQHFTLRIVLDVRGTKRWSPWTKRVIPEGNQIRFDELVDSAVIYCDSIHERDRTSCSARSPAGCADPPSDASCRSSQHPSEVTDVPLPQAGSRVSAARSHAGAGVAARDRQPANRLSSCCCIRACRCWRSARSRDGTRKRSARCCCAGPCRRHAYRHRQRCKR